MVGSRKYTKIDTIENSQKKLNVITSSSFLFYYFITLNSEMQFVILGEGAVEVIILI